MNTRIALAVLTALSTLSAIPADARQTGKARNQQVKVFDAAAVPAYPVTETTGRPGRRAASPSTKGLRTAAHSRRSREASLRPSHGKSGSGIVRSRKTGATAHVSPSWQPVAQAAVDALESAGASIYYMGGYRPGTCSLANQHACNGALDICQDSRGHVSGLRDCDMPPPAEFNRIITAAGAFGGEVWCNTDYGHIQRQFSGAKCSNRPSGWVGNGRWGYHYYPTMTGSIKAVKAKPQRRRYATRGGS